MYLTFRSRRWRYSRPRLRGKRGSCDSPSTPRKQILVSSHLHGIEELEINLHEFIHAALWDLDEEAVDETASDLARALWRLGYVRRSSIASSPISD